MPINDLIHKRGTLLEEARKILETVQTEKRSMTAEESEKFDQIHRDADALKESIDREKRQKDAEALAFASDRTVPLQVGKCDSTDPAERAQAEMRAFNSLLRNGYNGMTTEERAAIQTTTGAPGGGYLIPTLLANQIFDIMKWYGGVIDAPCTDMNTSGGEPMTIPTADDTGFAASGSLLAEGTAATTQTNPTFASVALNAYTFSSDIVACSVQVMQDAAFDLGSYLTRALGIRLGRGLNYYYTLGSGTAQPKGVVTGANVITSSVTNGFNYTDTVTLFHSLDRAYRGPSARFMCNDAVIAYARKLWDTYAGPLWQAGMAVGAPNTILGVPYIVNNDMTSTITTAKSLLIYGDFSYYARRYVQGIQLVRFSERYMDALQVGFLAYIRAGGNIASGATTLGAPFQILKAL